MGLKGQPFSQSMNSVRNFPIFTAQHDYLYKDSISLRNWHLMFTLESFVDRPSCQAVSYAFLKSTKQA